MRWFRRFQFFSSEKEIRNSADSLSEFFYNASDESKQRVLMEAAKRANEDQRRVFEEATLKLKTQ